MYQRISHKLSGASQNVSGPGLNFSAKGQHSDPLEAAKADATPAARNVLRDWRNTMKHALDSGHTPSSSSNTNCYHLVWLIPFITLIGLAHFSTISHRLHLSVSPSWFAKTRTTGRCLHCQLPQSQGSPKASMPWNTSVREARLSRIFNKYSINWCRMVQDCAGESLRSLCILCASLYDSDKAATRSRSCILNPVNPNNAVQNITWIKTVLLIKNYFKKNLPQVAASTILCVLYACVCVEAIISILPSPCDTKASSVSTCSLLLSPIIAGRQRPAVSHWLWRGCKKTIETKVWKYLKIHSQPSQLHKMSQKQWDFSNGFWLQDVAGAGPVSSSLSAVAVTAGPAWEGSQARHQQHLLPPGRSFVEISSRQRSGAKCAKGGKRKNMSVSLSISCCDLRCHPRLHMALLLWRMVRDG